MKYTNQLVHLLHQTQPHWDQDDFPPAARSAFIKASQCRTPALGAEVYADADNELIVCHTCKSRACSSCGNRATKQWQRERWAALPDVEYKGITLTMPDVLWRVFQPNPHLVQALPALAAKIIQARVSLKYCVRVGVIAIVHTFNGKLEFNSHVHTMVTAGGLHGSATWRSRLFYDRNQLMKSWRKAVILLLRSALHVDRLVISMSIEEMEVLLAQQENRWWNVKIQRLPSRKHFLGYAGRYVRRPPIAQHRITYFGDEKVKFCYRDKILKRRVTVEYSLKEFIDRWAKHIPERYVHLPRSFGLFAPRSVAGSSAAVFAILQQERRPRPKPRRWADSIKRDFGRDPLLTSGGARMKWSRRIPPKSAF